MNDTPDDPAPDADDGEPVLVNVSDEPDADLDDLADPDEEPDAVDRIQDPALREAARKLEEREAAQEAAAEDVAEADGAQETDDEPAIPKREYVQYARALDMEPAEAEETLARMTEAERARAYEAAGLDIEPAADADGEADETEGAGHMSEIELEGDPEDPDDFFADFEAEHGFDPREQSADQTTDADPESMPNADATTDDTSTDESTADMQAADTAGQAQAQAQAQEPETIDDDEETLAATAQDRLAGQTPMQAPSMDPAEYEDQDWTLGEDTGDKEINYKGTRFLLSEPAEEAELTLMEVLNDQSASPQLRYKTVLQTIIAAPTITDARYQQMKGSERMALVGACLEYWGIDDFVDFREQ